MLKKLINYYHKLTKEEYEVRIVEYDKEGLIANSYTIKLKKIIKINNKFLKGTDTAGNVFITSSTTPFNYTIKKIY